MLVVECKVPFISNQPDVSMLFSVDHIAVSGARQFHPGPYMSRSHDFHHAFFPVSTVSKIIQMEENM